MEESTGKILGVTIDKDWKLNKHISNICMKASRKLTALGRLSRFLSLDQRRMLMKSFIESQFAYCPLVWMFHNREWNNR